MKGFRYKITVEPLDGINQVPLEFEVGNHDNLLEVAQAVREKRIVGEDDSAALAIGLKLLVEIALQQRTHPLFAQLVGPLRVFVSQLKAAGS